MQPHLVRWRETYESQGLQIVYLNDGRKVPQSGIAEIAAAVPVFHDATGAASQAYGVKAYPTAYILDRSGTVVWEGIPVFNPAAVEQAIAQALDSGR